MPSKDEIKLMVNEAVKAEKNSFIFKSKYAIGASVLTESGKVFSGCNIDGVISSQGMCAEVVAINNAVTHGEYAFRAVLVFNQKGFFFPCGSCLQYLNQFSQVNDRDIEIIVVKKKGEYKLEKLSRLLPKGYKSASFDEKLKGFYKK